MNEVCFLLISIRKLWGLTHPVAGEACEPQTTCTIAVSAFCHRKTIKKDSFTKSNLIPHTRTLSTSVEAGSRKDSWITCVHDSIRNFPWCGIKRKLPKTRVYLLCLDVSGRVLLFLLVCQLCHPLVHDLTQVLRCCCCIRVHRKGGGEYKERG